MLPTLRLILLIAAAAPLFLGGAVYDFFTGIGVIYMGLLAVYTLLCIVTLPRPQDITIKRIVPERISIHYPTRILLEIENTGRKDLTVMIAEDFPEDIRVEPASLMVHVKAGRRKTVEYRLTAFKRGRYRLSGFFVRLLPNTRLLYRQFKRTRPADIKVFPNLMNIRRYELLTRRGYTPEEGMAPFKLARQGSEFESLRQYVPGDELSKVDWKASAKTGKLIVKNHEPERRQNIMVALDVGRATAGEFGEMSRVDYLVNATLMLAYISLKQKDWFSLVAFSDRIEMYLPPISGIKNVDRVAEALYELTPRLVESDYGAACQFIAAKNRKRSLLCLMTDIISKEASSVVIAYLSRFARYHLPVAVTLSNPEVIAVAHAPLFHCTDYYSKAVALDLIASRKEALTLMRRQGIGVLDTLPDKLTPELINRYLMIKSKKML